MKNIAVTGTNGKTTTVELLYQLLEKNRQIPATLGTLGLKSTRFRDKHPILIGNNAVAKLISELKDTGEIAMFAFEAYSTAIASGLYDAVNLDLMAYTNIHYDHLDYHDTRQQYAQAKLRLLENLKRNSSVICFSGIAERFDIQSVCKRKGANFYTYGIRKSDTLFLKSYSRIHEVSRVQIVCDGLSYKVLLPFTGYCFILNWLCAIGIAFNLGIRMEALIRFSESLYLPRGRFEKAGEYNDALIYVDFASNGHALETVLKELRNRDPNKIHLVFGCGGQADPNRRKDMGRIANVLADFVYICDDNPRFENPVTIRKEIQAHCPNGITYSSREEAIREALYNLLPGDMLLIAGKGHEEYQQLGDKLTPYSDFQTVNEVIRSATKSLPV